MSTDAAWRTPLAFALWLLVFACAESSTAPRFHRAFRLRSRPAGVRGPVLRPPCIRQRPFFIAVPSQAVPRLVFAPQRGALEISPGGLKLPGMARTFEALARQARLEEDRVSAAGSQGSDRSLRTFPLFSDVRRVRDSR